MLASKSSGRLRSFELALGAVIILAGVAYSLYSSRQFALLDGDAEAHLNIARRLLDSRTPGPEQIGTAWLPLPHVIMAPFAMRDAWWKNGLAGSIPSALAFAATGAFLWGAMRRAFGHPGAALASLAVLMWNPNAMYLGSAPMTEMLFAAALAALLWATLWFRDTQSLGAVVAASAASIAASLTRYEGWFLIPFVAGYFYWAGNRKSHAALFAVLASLAPLAWLAHNQYYYSSALEFYNGPWSAQAIHQRQVAKGVVYPTDHNWAASISFYAEAVRGMLGWATVALAGLGLPLALARARWPVILLSLCPAFYLWGLYSGSVDLYVPRYWPHSSYNLRYAFPALLLGAFLVGALFSLPRREYAAVGALLLLLPVVPFGKPDLIRVESEVNSAARRAVQHEAARYLGAHYRPGAGILLPFGEGSGILREAGIPLREGLHDGNHPEWEAALASPAAYLREEWALATPGGEVSIAIAKAVKQGRPYRLHKRITEKDSTIEIYHLE